MTYYSSSYYKSYDFTAFSASDLGLGSSASTGEKFTMPGSATVCITVRDDDGKLSGDDRYNEKANDSSGQTASIKTTAGHELGNGGQIYAESYFWVSDQHGNWYVMIEIEQEHSDQDYLAFYTGGGYTVPPAGAQLTFGSQCNVEGNWLDYSCIDSGPKTEPLGSLGGRLFIDSNHDNTEVDGSGGWEKGFDGATVSLIDAHGNIVATTKTDHYGVYKFDGIAAGDYTVHFEEPGGYDFVKQNVGDDGADSDVNQTSGKTASVHVGAGKNVWNVDAGIKEEPDASIKGRLFVDSNHDNTEIDASHGLEAGFGGATVRLLDAHGNIVATTTTDADGNYKFDGLSAGNYVIHVEEPEGYGFVKKDQGDYRFDSDVDQHTGKTASICLTNDSDVCDIDIGIKQQTGSINGTVFCDTDCDGKSAETTIVPGNTYTVEAEDMNLCYVDVVHGAQASGGKLVKINTTNYYDDGYLQTHFQGEKGTYDIKLAVQDENDGQSTIYVKVNGHLVEAVKLDRDSDGAGDNNGSFSTFVVKDVHLSKGDDVLLIVDGKHSEYVRIDKLDFVGEDKVVTTAEPVKSGVTINLLNAAGDIIATTMTDADGNYHFNNVAVGDYTIQGVAPDGTEFTIQDVNGNSHDDIDSDVNASGMSGTISVVANGSTDIDLGVCEVKTGSLSGTYFCDDNRNGIDDAGDLDIAGKTVTLLDAAGNVVATTTTDAAGDYRFDDLEAGDYSVSFEATEGKEFIAKDVGADDTVDSDVNPANGTTDPVTVVAGAETKDIDAGVQSLLGSLSGRYFEDGNKDGLDNDGADNGIEGVQVTLKDAGGNTLASTTTNAAGNYAFTGLMAGVYSVMFTDAVSGKELTTPNVGTDDAIDSDALDLGGGMSVISGITVVAGADTPDNDAGVVEPNTPPEAHDDAGKGCAEEEIVIDVLANDSDAQDGKPVVTAVNGTAIADGVTIVVDGVSVTLSGGTLSFDGEAAFSALDIGEEATVTYTYTVTDSGGATAVASIDVTYCGDANSVDSFCDSLPEEIQYQISTSSVELPYEDEAFDIKLTSTDGRFDGVIFEDAYCLSIFDPADVAETFDTASLLSADVFCFEDAPADVFNADQISIANGKTAGENLDVVNWILNQDFKDQGFSDWEIQRTIWELTDNIDTDYLDAIDPAFGDGADVDTLVALAVEFDTNKTGEYTPGLGDKIGIILDPVTASSSNAQPFIIAMEIEPYDCIC